jgi:molybdopterin converting factor subunit 1
MIVRVHLFAGVRDLAGTDTLAVELPEGATVAQLQAELTQRLPAVAGLVSRSAVAVNHEFASPEQVLTATDEVALIPPVSGG